MWRRCACCPNSILSSISRWSWIEMSWIWLRRRAKSSMTRSKRMYWSILAWRYRPCISPRSSGSAGWRLAKTIICRRRKMPKRRSARRKRKRPLWMHLGILACFREFWSIGETMNGVRRSDHRLFNSRWPLLLRSGKQNMIFIVSITKYLIC